MAPSETRIAGLHLPVAMALFAVGVLNLVLDGLQGYPVLEAAWPIALGGFVVLIVGTGRMLLAGTGGVDVVGKAVWWLPGGLVAIGSVGMWLGFDGGAWLLPLAAIAWGTGLGLHVLLVGFSVARGRTERAIAEGWPVGLTVIAALGYGLAASLAVPLAMTGWLDLFAALHLALTGFVVTTIAAVAIEVMPRFTGAGLPRAWTAPMAVALALGPALLAEGFQGAPRLLRAGAIVEALGLALLGAGLVWMVLAAERRRASFVLYAAGGASAVLGAGLGALVVLGVISYGQVAWHGAVNLLGFVGLVVLGAVVDLFAPALAAGAEWLEHHNQAVIGLALLGTAAVWAAPWIGGLPTRIGLGAYLAAVVLHLAGSLRRL